MKTNIWNLLISGSAGFVGGVIGGTFKWFFPSFKDVREGRQTRVEAKIDAKVLTMMKSIFDQGSMLYGSHEIAGMMSMDAEKVADSLERLESRGRMRRFAGTNDDPSPSWDYIPR